MLFAAVDQALTSTPLFNKIFAHEYNEEVMSIT